MASPGTPPRRKRGRRSRAPLSRERILEKALELVGRDPDGELSMRALADALGTAPMSLYRHVRNKDDLLDGVTGLAMGRLELDLPETGAWTERALAWMHGVRGQFHQHPAVVPLLRTHTRYAPALLRLTNTLLQIVRSGGLDDAATVRAPREIMWFTFGFVVMELRTQETFPDTEVGALAVSAFPAPGSAEAAELSDLVELMPHLVKGDVDETFAAGARHLLAGIVADVATAGSAR
jgi:AcrR family transcriptional regulator